MNRFEGPTLGPKETVPNRKEWTEDQLRAARHGVIILQSGSNKGATQKGMIFGLGRQVFTSQMEIINECD